MMRRTFTKAEVMPQFPGGEEALNDYLTEYCRRHNDQLPKHKQVTVFVQFTVHSNGQLTDLRVASQDVDPKLGDLAMQALQEGPKWNSATQNGRKVICFKVLPLVLARPH